MRTYWHLHHNKQKDNLILSKQINRKEHVGNDYHYYHYYFSRSSTFAVGLSRSPDRRAASSNSHDAISVSSSFLCFIVNPITFSQVDSYHFIISHSHVMIFLFLRFCLHFLVCWFSRLPLFSLFLLSHVFPILVCFFLLATSFRIPPPFRNISLVNESPVITHLFIGYPRSHIFPHSFACFPSLVFPSRDLSLFRNPFPFLGHRILTRDSKTILGEGIRKSLSWMHNNCHVVRTRWREKKHKLCIWIRNYEQVKSENLDCSSLIFIWYLPWLARYKFVVSGQVCGSEQWGLITIIVL